jgi:hypothetical protein
VGLRTRPLPAGNAALSVRSSGFKDFNLSNFYLGVGRTNEIDARLEVGTVAETVEVRAASPTISAETATLSGAVGKLQAEAEAKGLGDYFEYVLKQTITIGKNQSALVPILQAHVEAEKVTLWSQNSKSDDDDDQSNSGVPLRSLWVTNTSGLTLDSGTFNILDGGTLAGEGLIKIVHPNERRVLSYAADTAVHIRTEDESTTKPVSQVKIAKGLMTLRREERARRTYTVRNADTSPRQVILEHPMQEGWKLAEGSPKPEETAASVYRFRVAVGPGTTEHLTVESYHPEETVYQLTNLDDDLVKLLVDQQRVTPAMNEAFRRILGQKNQISDLQRQIKFSAVELDAIAKDQVRIRENMKALKGSAEEKVLLQRYTHELDSQEDRLGILGKDIAELQAKQTSAQAELDRMVQSVSVDESF